MTEIRRTSSIAMLLILGLAIREIFAPFTGHPFDFELWIRIGYYVSRGDNPYVVTAPIPNLSFPGAQYMTWIGYPPTWAFFQSALYKLYTIISVNNRFFYYFMIKQPMIIADLVSGYIIYRIILGYSGDKAAFRALLFWLFCPITILISSVWGMFDQIILVLVLSSILLSLETKKSALMESLGFLLKVIPLIYVPFLAFVQRSKMRIIEYLVIFLGTSFVFTVVPFFFFRNWKISQLIGVGIDVTHKIGYSMNYWMILTAYDNYHPITNSQASFFQNISLIWVPALIISTYFCLISIRKSVDLQKGMYISALFITLTFFLTKSIINEQYSIYFLGLGLIDYYVFGDHDRKRYFHLIWISVLAYLFVNNTYLVRFLTPISTYYRTLDLTLESGFAGDVRITILVTIAMLFTFFCAMYLASLYRELCSIRAASTDNR
ncbi:MAG: hypothetical protein JRN52_10915 [Nitrososphaerota archaeon]|nr:hypothetical protein [Nitrososphaerota archaeon]